MLASTHPSHFDHGALARALLVRKPVLATKIARACGIGAEAVEPALIEVLRFVNLAAYARERLGHGLTPSVVVDEAWHELILCTREYRELCTTYFGGFVDHDPNEGDDARDQTRFRATLRLYALHFGNPDSRWWGPAADALPALAEAACGACQT